MQWNENNTIQVTPPRKPKKLTGTRFASVLGLNRWSTPFEIWCACTRTYEAPFEDTIYTKAGKAIEPKQAEYMKSAYFMSNLITPTDVYGPEYFHETWGDFFHSEKIFGGMWDYLLVDKENRPTTVLEMKTTQRAEDWKDDIPEYYALQAALYAYLLGVDKVIMVASFLSPEDYADPEKFECNGKNTITRPFRLSERYPDFEEKYIKPAIKWWQDHVETGISPVYNEKADAEILAALRTNNVTPDTDIDTLVKEAEELKAKLDAHAAEVAADEKRYKLLVDNIKKLAVSQFRDGDKKVSIVGSSYAWEVSKSSKTTIDKEAMKADGVLEKYSSTEDSYRIVPKEIKKDQ